MNETQYTKKIRTRLEQNGWLVHKTSERFTAGWPDLIAIKDRVLFIEVKVGTNTLTPLQWVTLKEIDRHGGTALLLIRDDAGIESLTKIMKGDLFHVLSGYNFLLEDK